ncbi:hypothetical protein TVAG_303580 [Trichomonas vaginalis G3]|uniref:Uncharacterized protein n=1 Tax=Trichomonas vaginalis (strain ATCC PRA-98 / G3) TaxID=412133 RepID=A2DR40_TRIV3|nr:hypothetical protein TVAGG3_0694990 [Trichomonas vaginalis G3]EAY17139.1 hypothetical protein TVAG_303580 [Trichomonas vaginalis G3]KAI5508855.1 hypothetical protein TVAGG3_0694990 [Trichomonas vaginalis G3]|eukprot:XP_001329362.1 hypothetical protein [Trichomonas vaginalis G3]
MSGVKTDLEKFYMRQYGLRDTKNPPLAAQFEASRKNISGFEFSDKHTSNFINLVNQSKVPTNYINIVSAYINKLSNIQTDEQLIDHLYDAGQGRFFPYMDTKIQNYIQYKENFQTFYTNKDIPAFNKSSYDITLNGIEMKLSKSDFAQLCIEAFQELLGDKYKK